MICTVALLIQNDKIIASGIDFEQSGYGGFSLSESQTIRAKRTCYWQFVIDNCSPIIARNIDNHMIDRIVEQISRNENIIILVKSLPVNSKDELIEE